MTSIAAFWRRHFLVLDTCAVIVSGSTLFIWTYYFNGAAFIEELLEGNRASIYSVSASVAAALLGFSLTVIAIVVGFSSYERLSIVRKSKHYSTLWEVFFSTVTALLALLCIAFVCLIVDSDKRPILWLETVFFSVLLLSAIRIFRSIGVLKRIVWLIAMPPSEKANAYCDDA